MNNVCFIDKQNNSYQLIAINIIYIYAPTHVKLNVHFLFILRFQQDNILFKIGKYHKTNKKNAAAQVT